MRRLTKSNIYRLFHFKPFWIAFILVNIIQAFMSLILVQQGCFPIEFSFFFSLIMIGLLSPFYLSIFYGTEYSDGTIRNKIIAGFERSNIYLSSLFTGIVATSILYFSSLVVGIIISFKRNIIFNDDIYHYLFILLVGWIICIALSTIFNIIGMLCATKSKTSMTSIIMTFISFIMGLICYSLYSQSIGLNSSSYFFQFLFDINPFVQGIQLFSINVLDICKISLYSIITSLIINSFGVNQFSKKDIK